MFWTGLKNFWNTLSFFNKIFTISISLGILCCLIALIAGRILSVVFAVVWIIAALIALLINKNIIKVSKAWISFLIVFLSFVLALPYYSLFKFNISDYNKYNWDEIVLSDMLPVPESPYGELKTNSYDQLLLYVTKLNPKQYNNYVVACQTYGFNIDPERIGDSFEAFNDKGYKLCLTYDDYDNEMCIYVLAGKSYGCFEWPTSGMAQIIPTPKSTIGEISSNTEELFSVYVSDTSYEEFTLYIDECKSMGFIVEETSSKKYFSAKNTDSYKLSIEYKGNSIIYISLTEPKFTVTLEVECVENWVFNTYNVNVYVNDNYTGYISHGKSDILVLSLPKGTHELNFYSSENRDISGKVEFYIEKEETLKYRISCFSNNIDIETILGSSSESKPSEEDTQQGINKGDIDYANAESFEKALNNGEKVKGKTVRFFVKEYHPDSLFGINCFSGEHLNFISEKELNVGTGNIITGRITEEPSKFLFSWKIPYEVISIEGEKIKVAVTMNKDDFLGMDYKDAENKLKEMGFVNFQYVTVSTGTASRANTIGHIEIKENLFPNSYFKIGDKFYYDSLVSIHIYKYDSSLPSTSEPVFYSTNDYETAKKGNTGVFSYRSRGNSYDIYWIIDFDKGYVYYFTDGDGESWCDRLVIDSGTLNDRITITYHDGDDIWSYRLHFKYENHPETLIMVDQNGFESTYSTTDLSKALAIRATKRITDY